MYTLSGSRRVEVWGGAQPVKNVQLQFNAPPPPALLQVHSAGAEDPEEAARECERLRRQRKQEDLEALQRFRIATVRRLRVWAGAEARPAFVPLNDAASSSGEGKTETEGSDLGDVQSLLTASKCESVRARAKLLRFTRGRRSFRVVSDPTSPTFAQHTNAHNNSTVTSVSHSASGWSGQLSSALGHTWHGSSETTEVGLPAAAAAEAAAAAAAANATTGSTFVGPRAFRSKQMVAEHKALVRKKEAAFGRLMARRRRDLQAHHRLLQEQRRRWTKAHADRAPAEAAAAAAEAAAARKEAEAAESHARRQQEEEARRRRGRDEAQRYISALQHRLEELTRSKTGAQLPQLCRCHGAASQTRRVRGPNAVFQEEGGGAQDLGTAAPWEKCANNCRFYRNPQAYAKELADLFRSLKL